MKPLPPGQKASDLFPRFGLPQYANRFPTAIDEIRFSIGGDLEEFEVSEELGLLPRAIQHSDFHCVTTWSKLDLNWSGYKFGIKGTIRDFEKATAAHRALLEAESLSSDGENGSGS